MDNVFGVYRPDGLPEMPITSTWSDEFNCYKVSVVGADIDLLVKARSARHAFEKVAVEDLPRELGAYALTRGM